MVTVAETLRAAREKKALDLEYIADTLKIRVKYLEALEQGNYDIFPSPLYIKGFLKNYASFLGIDEDQILALYRREYSSPQHMVGGIGKYQQNIRSIKFALKPSHIVALCTIAIVFAIGGYLFFEYKSYAVPPILKITSPNDNEVVTMNNITVIGTTDAGDSVSINGTQIPNISDNGNFSMAVNLHSGANELVITATNNLNKSSTIKRNIILNTSTSTTTPPTASSGGSDTGGPLYARLQVLNSNTWIHVKSDGKVIYNDVFMPGKTVSFTAQTSIEIETGIGANTNLAVNGQNIDLTGNGVIDKTITLTQAGNIVVK